MNAPLIAIVIVSGALGLAGCENQQDVIAKANTRDNATQRSTEPIVRWYNQAQVERGNELYQANCASCHKPDASGTPNWKQALPDGKYPPPPLNGTAHAWHHPLSILQRQIKVGGVPLGGTMPGFGNKLNEAQINEILAWVQSHWPDDIYRIWHERNVQAGKS